MNCNSLRDVKTGSVSEQTVAQTYRGNCLKVRRVVVRLKKVTRDGDWEIAIPLSLLQLLPVRLMLPSCIRGVGVLRLYFKL